MLIEKINNILNDGESVQLVCLPGSGASRILRKACSIYLDLNSLENINLISFCVHLTQVLRINTPSDNPQLLIQNIIDKTKNVDLIIGIDNFDKIARREYAPIHSFLKELRDNNKYHIRYVFSVKDSVPITFEQKETFGGLIDLLTENVLYLESISRKDFDQELKDNFSEFIKGLEIDVDSLFNLTGGIRPLVKEVLRSIRDKQEIAKNPRIENVLMEMIADVKTDNKKLLLNFKLSSPDGKIYSSILANYLTKKQNAKELSFTENQLLLFLKENKGRFVSKEEIINLIYPAAKNINGISDTAIDQLIYRLRTKIKDKESIETKRGCGIKLS